MQSKLPVIACTDKNTDIGDVMVSGKFGCWCESDNANSFVEVLKTAMQTDVSSMKDNEFLWLLNNYSIDNHYKK